MKRKIEFRQSIIVLLDILGTKGIWRENNDLGEIVKKYDKVIELFWNSIPKAFDGADNRLFSVTFQNFSDTIIMVIECPEKAENTKNFIDTISQELIYPFIESMKLGIFFRGVISAGEIFVRKTENRKNNKSRLIIGPAIDEASSWFEQTDWIGISLTPSAKFLVDVFLNEKNQGLLKKLQGYNINSLYKWDIPLKNGKRQDSYAINWPLKLIEEINLDSLSIELDSVLTLNSILEKFVKRPIGVEVNSKYENTMKFFEHVKAKYESELSEKI